MIEVYEYSYIDRPRLTRTHAQLILDHAVRRIKEFTISLDLGLTKSKAYFDGNFKYVLLNNYWISIDLLKELKGNAVYEVVDNDKIVAVTRRTPTGFYKLMAVNGDTAPTLEINGIHMHRIKDITPWEDSKLKVKAARVRRGCRVLDTCMGLGYTAILSLLRGATEVYTVEIDEVVLEISQHNPWSRILERRGIIIIKGDIFKVIDELPNNYFHTIIHDPPRFTSTSGDLYSEEFYRKLCRVLRPRGTLFHYTGEPGKHRIRFVKGVMERLRKAGFYHVKWINGVKGVIAYKLEW